jgi:hypothetical protein
MRNSEAFRQTSVLWSLLPSYGTRVQFRVLGTIFALELMLPAYRTIFGTNIPFQPQDGDEIPKRLSQRARCHIQGSCNLHTRSRLNLKSH